ncbi:MAG: lipopolysaccharide biosynthesis protein [Gemmatimonadaceae bacterium]|nr:lipopolysaccharide biosynthesis protein [Gemmatimonadaceae bacterium]
MTSDPARKASKAGLRSVLIFAAGEMGSRAISFLLLPLYTRQLTPVDYGTLQLIVLVFEVVGLFGITRVTSGLFRYYALQVDERSRNSYVASAFLIVSASHLLIALFVYYFADALSVAFLAGRQQSELLHLGAAMFAVQGLTAIPAAYQRLLGRPLAYVRQVLALQFLQAGLNVVFVVGYGYGVRGVLLSGILSYLIVGGVVSTSMVLRLRQLPSTQAIRTLVKFTLPLTFGSVALLVVMMGGRYALKQSSSIAEVGLYALAVTFGGVSFQLGASPFLQFWEPARFRIAKQENRDVVFAQDFIRFNVVLLIVATTIGVFVRDYLSLAASPAYATVGHLVPITLLAYLFQGWTSVLDTGALLAGRTAQIAVGNWISAVFALLGFWLLIPRWGAAGAATTLLISFAVRCAYIAVASQLAFKIAWKWRPILLLVGMSSVIVLAAYSVPEKHVVVSLAAHSLFLFVFMVLATSSRIIGTDDAERLRQILRSVIQTPTALVKRFSA